MQDGNVLFTFTPISWFRKRSVELITAPSLLKSTLSFSEYFKIFWSQNGEKKIGRKSKSSENNIIELSTPFAISNARAHHANSDIILLNKTKVLQLSQIWHCFEVTAFCFAVITCAASQQGQIEKDKGKEQLVQIQWNLGKYFFYLCGKKPLSPTHTGDFIVSARDKANLPPLMYEILFFQIRIFKLYFHSFNFSSLKCVTNELLTNNYQIISAHLPVLELTIPKWWSWI